MNNRSVVRKPEADDGESQAWRPEPGDEIEGVVVGIDGRSTSFSGAKEVPVFVLQDDAGKRWDVWLFHDVLAQEMLKYDPEPGEWVNIKRLTDGAGAKHNYKRYRVTMRRGPARVFDWKKSLGDAGAMDVRRDPNLGFPPRDAESRDVSGDDILDDDGSLPF